MSAWRHRAALEVRKREPDNQAAITFAEEAVQTARQALD